MAPPQAGDEEENVSFEIRESRVLAGGVEFSIGIAGSGPPVVLLPGSGGWRLTFEGLVERLAEHRTVVAVDPPGQGGTVIRDPSFAPGVDSVARSIGALIEALSLTQPVIIGHSWGGGFALRLAQLEPERVGRLALIAPGGLDVPDVWEFRLMRMPGIGELALRFVTRSSVVHMLRKSFADPGRVPLDRVDAFLRMTRAEPDRAARRRDTLMVERSVDWAETEAHLSAVRMPVLVLWGSADRYFAVSLLPRLVSALPAAEWHVLPGGGHSLHDDLPEQTWALLAPFLGVQR